MGSVSLTESRMTVHIQTVLLLLSCMTWCEGRLTSCTTTCCMSCQLRENCEGYRLSTPGSLHCPCLHSLTGPELRRLSHLTGGRCAPPAPRGSRPGRSILSYVIAPC